jgi:c-di-GMP-binding flagellar brake protein YcgR
MALGVRMKANYILIDYENVQPEAVALINQEHFKVKVFVGTSQTKVSFEVASTLQSMGERVEYIKIAGTGEMPLTSILPFILGKSRLKSQKRTFMSFQTMAALIH